MYIFSEYALNQDRDQIGAGILGAWVSLLVIEGSGASALIRCTDSCLATSQQQATVAYHSISQTACPLCERLDSDL